MSLLWNQTAHVEDIALILSCFRWVSLRRAARREHFIHAMDSCHRFRNVGGARFLEAPRVLLSRGCVLSAFQLLCSVGDSAAALCLHVCRCLLSSFSSVPCLRGRPAMPLFSSEPLQCAATTRSGSRCSITAASRFRDVLAQRDCRVLRLRSSLYLFTAYLTGADAVAGQAIQCSW